MTHEILQVDLSANPDERKSTAAQGKVESWREYSLNGSTCSLALSFVSNQFHVTDLRGPNLVSPSRTTRDIFL